MLPEVPQRPPHWPYDAPNPWPRESAKKENPMGYTMSDLGLAEHDGAALVLEPGKTYVVEMLRPFPHDGLLHLKDHLKAEEQRTGIKFVIVGPGLHVRPASWWDRLMAWANQ